MPAPQKYIPLHNDLKSLQTLLSEGLTHKQISDYYKDHGIQISRKTISNRVKELNK